MMTLAALLIAELAPAARWVVLGFVACFGACIGSFLNVVLYRLPRGESIVWPGSHCPHCKHEIRPWHNVPIVGWLLLRGRCYDCRQSISPRYPLNEAAVAVAMVLAAWASPWL
jgi:leader peptidase (prepilin peptidase)/N-methyltransferase